MNKYFTYKAWYIRRNYNKILYEEKASLAGKSSGGVPSWKKYVVDLFNKIREMNKDLEKGDQLGKELLPLEVKTVTNSDINVVYDLVKPVSSVSSSESSPFKEREKFIPRNSEVKILDDTIFSHTVFDEISKKTKKVISLAKVNYQNEEIFIPLSFLSKPKQELKRILGGLDVSKNYFISSSTMELSPSDLGLENKSFSSYKTLEKVLRNKIYEKFKDKLEKKDSLKNNIAQQIYEYLNDCITFSIENSQEIEMKDNGSEIIKVHRFGADKKYNLTEQDLKIISKNFGEVFSALLALKNLNFVEKIEYPEASNTLYDFSGIGSRNIFYFFSVKTEGARGSALQPFLTESNINKLESKYKREIKNNPETKLCLDIIKRFSSKTRAENLVSVSQEIIKKYFPHVLQELLNQINITFNKIGYELKDIRIEDLDQWHSKIISSKKYKPEFIVEKLLEIYERVLGISNIKNDTKRVMINLFDPHSGVKSTNHGYLNFFLVSFIIKFLNKNETFKNMLNDLIKNKQNEEQEENVGIYYYSFVDCNNEFIKVKYVLFNKDQINYKVSYNASLVEPNKSPIRFEIDKIRHPKME